MITPRLDERFFLRMRRNDERLRTLPTASKKKLMQKIKRFVADAGRYPIHNSQLCERFCVSRPTLDRVFIDVLGIPAETYLCDKRLRNVRATLKNRRKPDWRKIAILQGFYDVAKFSRQYRQMFGELPRVTRRAPRQGN